MSDNVYSVYLNQILRSCGYILEGKLDSLFSCLEICAVVAACGSSPPRTLRKLHLVTAEVFVVQTFQPAAQLLCRRAFSGA